MKIPKYAARISCRLSECGYEVFFVGGCVRDLVMGTVPHDYDLTTNALPDEIKACFADYKTVLTGEAHGTVCVISDGVPIEITTYRCDGEYNDCRHPDKVSFTSSLEADLRRRDFTVNAMAYSDKTGIVDLFGGTEDIKNKLIRCVGEPTLRFGEDALRILRALRFSSRLGFEAAEKTASAIREMKSLIGKVSKERIFTELCGILAGDFAQRVLLEYPEVITEILPELSDCVGFDQRSVYHSFDVYTHSAIAVAACPDDSALRLAALFHDCAKPECFTLGEDGAGHFFGHEKKSAEKAQKALSRLRCPSRLKNTVCELIELHGRQLCGTEKAMKRFMRNTSEEILQRIFDLKRADCLSLAPKGRSQTDEITAAEHMMNKIIENEECISLRSLYVDGNILIENGFKPSKQLGEVLSALLDAVIDEKVENERSSLIEYAKKLKTSEIRPQDQSSE